MFCTPSPASVCSMLYHLHQNKVRLNNYDAYEFHEMCTYKTAPQTKLFIAMTLSPVAANRKVHAPQHDPTNNHVGTNHVAVYTVTDLACSPDVLCSITGCARTPDGQMIDIHSSATVLTTLIIQHV